MDVDSNAPEGKKESYNGQSQNELGLIRMNWGLSINHNLIFRAFQ